ncbi:MAG TPA: hypothetical protein VH092_05095 [Urbifossiella sp.]|jgi:hypothetical protein|nr:hypothetical protein [Urbifossiella sp.]
MAHVRAIVKTLVAAWFAAFCGAGLVSGQMPQAPPTRTQLYGEVAALKTAGGIPKQDLAKAKLAFEAFAKFHADYVSYPKTYTAPQEFRSEPPPPGSPLTIDQLINNEINRHILVPSPIPVPNPVGNQPGFALASGPNDADYIRELGIALDKSLGDVVRQSNDRIVRVNAARMLAAAARSGAHAHYPTITELITNPNTDPEVRYYALQGAANLLAAYDLNDYRSRKHSNGPKEVGALIVAVQDAVLKADALLPVTQVAAGKDVQKVVPPDQVPVLQFIRRQAVRALGQVRFAEFEVEKNTKLYPAHTLALVALSRVPIPTYKLDGDKVEVVAAPKTLGDSADAAEAVLGILNMAPPKGGAAAKQYAAPMAYVVASGVATWAAPRATNPADKSLPWKGTAARMEDGLKTWQGLFDVNFNPAQPSIKADLVPAPVAGVSKAITDNVLNPMNSPTGTVAVNLLLAFQKDVLRQDKGLTPQPFLPPTPPPALPIP